MEQKNNFLIPASIILAGFVIAGGIYLSDRGNTPVQRPEPTETSDIDVLPITEKDHILGNPDALVKIVEYSDTECPFCKSFHVTMHSIIDTYGKDGKVAWVYRHFPIQQLHPKALKEAEASECVNELGGSTAFWKFIDTLYANTPVNNRLEETKLPEFAKEAGVDVTAFNTCLSSGKYSDFINESVMNAQRAGANGTPYSVLVLKDTLSSDAEAKLTAYIIKTGLSQNVVISKSRKEISMSGALPLEMVKATLDSIVK